MNCQYTQCVVLCWLFGVSLLSPTESVSIRRSTSIHDNPKAMNVSSWPETTPLAPNSSSTSPLPLSSNSSSDIPLITTERSQHGIMKDLNSGEPLTFATSKQRTISPPSSITASSDGSIESRFLWKGVSIGLGSLCIIVLLSFVVTIAFLCRLRGQLKRMRTMLYPRDEEHVYDKLGTMKSKSIVKENGKVTRSESSHKVPVKVELKPLQVRVDQEMLDDEEIHSPMSPEPPPISLLISSKISSPHTHTASNNSVRENMPSVNTENNAYVNESFDKNEGSDSKQKCFINDVKNASDGNKNDESAEFTCQNDDNTDDEDLYEKYTYTATEAKVVDNTHVKHAKSFPEMTEKLEREHRQNSLSGLPESFLQRVNSQLGADGMPLQDIEEDFTAHFDSGIPRGQTSNAEQLKINESQSYENKQCENGYDVDISLNRSENKTIENFESNQNDKINSIDAKANGGRLLNPSGSVGFDLPYQDEYITGGQICEDSVYDNDDEGVLFNPFDEYMIPVTGIPKGPNTNKVMADKRIAGDIGSNEMFITDVEYEDVDGEQFGDEANKQNIFNKSGVSIQDGLPKLEPLEMLKTEQLRLRTDSSSTPDNYYLDLDEELPELKVEESKRISSQFPSDFYIRNLGSVEKLSNFDDNFVNDFESNFTLDTSNGLQFSSAFQNEGPFYQTVVFSDDTEMFGNESTT